MSDESNNQAIPKSHQMLDLCLELALLQMVQRVSKYLQDGVEEIQISPLVNALNGCKLAQSSNPRSASATFLNAIALFAEWEGKKL